MSFSLGIRAVSWPWYATDAYLSLADASANYSGACDVYDKLAAEGMMAITNLLYLKNSSLLAYISLLPVIDFRDATKLI